MNELLQLTLAELTQKLHQKDASAPELMSAVLDRIDETNDDLNAVVAMRPREELVADADAAQKRIDQDEGRPLEGVPFGVKDLEGVGGMVTSYGSVPFADNLAEQDSVQVSRLRAAGAIVVGKTNTPEFGFTAITKNHLFGASRSPWNLEHSPGGSSGGSAAAIASCMLPLVTSSDGGGSIRIPASFTGAFGLKPSLGRVPHEDMPGNAWDSNAVSCFGPLTKTVSDAALFLDTVAGPSPRDPYSLPHPGYSYAERLEEELPAGLRLAYSSDLGYASVQDDVAEAVEQGAKVLEGLGHRIEPISGGPPDLSGSWGASSRFELVGQLHEVIRERPDDMTRSWVRNLKKAWDMTPELWGEAARQRMVLNDWCAEVFSEHDLLVTPTVPYDPPPARGPFPTEINGKTLPPVGVAAFTIPFNLSWHPAATVRCGISERGLPIGLQIVGPRHADLLVLQAARAYERERPWHPNWPTSWSPRDS